MKAQRLRQLTVFLAAICIGVSAPSRLSAQLSSSHRVHLSPGVVEGNLIHMVAPKYPENAKAKHIEGTVVLTATIGRDGRIKSLRTSSGPDELVPAAIDAAKQWRYQPFILHGKPVEVEAPISLTFSLLSK